MWMLALSVKGARWFLCPGLSPRERTTKQWASQAGAGHERKRKMVLPGYHTRVTLEIDGKGSRAWKTMEESDFEVGAEVMTFGPD